AGSALAATGLTDHAERLAAVDGEIDPIDRAYPGHLALQQALGDGKVLLQAADLEQRLRHDPSIFGLTSCAQIRRRSAAGRWQRTRWPPPASPSSGTWVPPNPPVSGS